MQVEEKKSIAIDLKKKESINLIKDIVKSADVVIEGLRPGKMEKLEMGPSDFLKLIQNLFMEE